MIKDQHLPSGHRAQAIIEIAIFGSIIIFLLGVIVSQGFSASFQQDLTLRTFRAAMHAAQEKTSVSGRPHEIALPYSILVIEDRIAPAVAKYGATSRSAYMSSASAMLSKDLYYTKDVSDAQLPRFNMKINGTMYSYTTAFWQKDQRKPSECQTIKACGGQTGVDCPAGAISWYWHTKTKKEMKNMWDAIKDGGVGSCDVDGRVVNGKFDEEAIYKVTNSTGKITYLDAHAGQYDPSDPDQGLQADMQITTQVNKTLTKTATSGRVSGTQTDIISRKFKGNGWETWLKSTLTR